MLFVGPNRTVATGPGTPRSPLKQQHSTAGGAPPPSVPLSPLWKVLSGMPSMSGGAAAAAAALDAAATADSPRRSVIGSSGSGSGMMMMPIGSAAGAGPGRHARYYARVMVNGHLVGTSENVVLREDFTAEFHDVFR
jgi:hypothetical protein